MAEKEKRVTLMTPKGPFAWPKLTEPDYGSNDYPDPDGSYSVKLILKEDDKATKSFIKKLEVIHAEAVKTAEAAFKELKVATRKKLGEVTVNPLYTVVYDDDTEEPTGELEFKFKSTAGGTYKKGPKEGKKWERKMPLFDAAGTPLKKLKGLWGGTVGIINFEPRPYFIPGTAAAGLKLNLEAVQVLELVAGGDRAASSFGFGQEEGFSADDIEDEDEVDPEAAEEDTDAEDEEDF